MTMLVFEVEAFRLFLLVLVRFSGLIVTAPILGSANFPVMAKIGLAALAAFLVLPGIPALENPLPDDPIAFAALAFGELAVGLMIGFVMTLVFAAIQVAGEIIDMLTGFAVVNVFNPSLETQVPVFGFFLFVIAALYLLTLNGHHTMLLALNSTYASIPPGGFVAQPKLFFEVSAWAGPVFRDSILVAAPVAGALLLAYLTMGLLGRVVPQINLFVVGFPVTIAIGLLMAGLSIELYIKTLDGLFGAMFRQVAAMVQAMS
ncbi:MAG TPA: flagellar biosynthetic protein FliR [Candidatus Hydrogenedentes bacterium]|nr:flagellar biosynthetic protein FliR [Candidatus Hydrogenedentota bacterium]